MAKNPQELEGVVHTLLTEQFVCEHNYMKSDKKAWAVEQAYKFYDDFDSLDVDEVVTNLHALIKDGTLRDSQINVMLENMITVFTELEEYEKCHICNQIKIKFDFMGSSLPER